MADHPAELKHREPMVPGKSTDRHIVERQRASSESSLADFPIVSAFFKRLQEKKIGRQTDTSMRRIPARDCYPRTARILYMGEIGFLISIKSAGRARFKRCKIVRLALWSYDTRGRGEHSEPGEGC